MLRYFWQLLTGEDPADAIGAANRHAFLRMCVVLSALCLLLVVSTVLFMEPGLRYALDAGSGAFMALGFGGSYLIARRRRLRLAAWVAAMSMVQPLIWGDLILGQYTEKLYFLPAGVILAGFGMEPRTMWFAHGVMIACVALLAALLQPPLLFGNDFNPTLLIDILALSTGMAAFMDTFVRSTRAAQRRAREQLEEADLQRRRAEAAATEAQVASNSKSMFLANVSHELRTPLNAILGYTELILEEAHEQGFSTLNADLDHIHRAATHLGTVINDILDMSRIEAGHLTLNPEPVPIHDLLDGLLATLRPLADKHHNTLVLTCDPATRATLLHTDRTRLRQILINLLSNACKFTDNGTVTLCVTTERIDRQDAVRFTVHDTGIGMDAATLARLFEPFVQASTSTPDRQSGTGLGLVITRRILHLLGGDVEVTSTLGQGSTFSAWLPLLLPPPSDPAILQDDDPTRAAP